MTAAAGLSRRIPRIRADHVSPAARAARTPVVRTPIGRTSGDAAPAHADHADASNTAASVSWLNESVSSSGGARPGRGVGTSVGRCRWRRMRAITEASSISAISRKRPPQHDGRAGERPRIPRLDAEEADPGQQQRLRPEEPGQNRRQPLGSHRGIGVAGRRANRHSQIRLDPADSGHDVARQCGRGS